MSVQSDFVALAGRALAAEGALRQVLADKPASAEGYNHEWIAWFDDPYTPALRARIVAVRDLTQHPLYPEAHRLVWRDSITETTTAAAVWLPIAVRFQEEYP